MAKKKSGESISFEEALLQLEETVAKLEQGDLKLDEAMELFGRGVELAADCNKKLASAQQRVEKIMQDAKGDLFLQPMVLTEE